MKRFCMPDGNEKSMDGMDGSHDVDHQDMIVHLKVAAGWQSSSNKHCLPTLHERTAVNWAGVKRAAVNNANKERNKK